MSSKYVATNKGSSTVGANFNSTATAITVATGEGVRLPAPTGGDYTLLVLQNTAGVREIICVVGRTGDVCTVGIPGSAAANVAGRNYEAIYGMAAAAWVIGDVVSCRPTAELIKAGVNFGDSIAAATDKATPVDADMLGLSDSAATNSSKKVTWANIKATLFAAWGALTTAGTSKATPVDADSLAICDSAAANATKKLTWANVKATLKAYFDTIYPYSEHTGVVKDYIGATAPSGYVLLSGRTIGNAASGATERANADTEALFTLLWEDMADAQAAVSSGRGASAAADYAANKTIALPDARGRVVAGKDDMGGSTASRLTNAGSGVVGTTLGVVGGAQAHTLAQSELAAHTHGLVAPSTVGSGPVGVNFVTSTGIQVQAAGGYQADSPASLDTSLNYASNVGFANNAHNNTQPTLVLNKIVKL